MNDNHYKSLYEQELDRRRQDLRLLRLSISI
jgi:hypothetical protein